METPFQPLMPLGLKQVIAEAEIKAVENFLISPGTKTIAESISDLLANLDDTVLDEIITQAAEEEGDEPPFTTEQFRTFFRQLVGSFLNLFEISPERRLDNLERMHETAKRIAKDKKVPLKDIYRHNDLYEAVVRQTFSPQEYQQKSTAAIDKITPQSVQDFSFSMVSAAAKTLLENEDSEDWEDLQGELNQMREDPEFIEQSQVQAETIHSALYVILQEELQRFYGEEGILNTTQIE